MALMVLNRYTATADTYTDQRGQHETPNPFSRSAYSATYRMALSRHRRERHRPDACKCRVYLDRTNRPRPIPQQITDQTKKDLRT